MRDQILGERARRQAMTGTARWPHADSGESTRDRADRLHRTVAPGSLYQLEDPQDGLAGALPRYTGGRWTVVLEA